jgi:hypothetical protein
VLHKISAVQFPLSGTNRVKGSTVLSSKSDERKRDESRGGGAIDSTPPSFDTDRTERTLAAHD